MHFGIACGLHGQCVCVCGERLAVRIEEGEGDEEEEGEGEKEEEGEGEERSKSTNRPTYFRSS